MTLIVDGVDQVDLSDLEQHGKVLQAFLNRYPRVRCVVAGRPFSIAKIWKRNKTNGLDLGAVDDETSRPIWEFLKVEKYSAEELEEYLGRRKFAATGSLDPSEIRVPRTANVIRRILAEELSRLENTAELYWYTQNESLEESLEKQDTTLTTSSLMTLAAGLAFGLWTWRSTPVMYAPDRRDASFDDFRKHLADSGIEARLKSAGIPDLDAALAESARINTDPLRFDFYREKTQIPGLEFSDATMRDFYAGHWMAKFMDDDQLPMLLTRRRGGEFRKAWRFALGMPRVVLKPEHGPPVRMNLG